MSQISLGLHKLASSQTARIRRLTTAGGEWWAEGIVYVSPKILRLTRWTLAGKNFEFTAWDIVKEVADPDKSKTPSG